MLRHIFGRFPLLFPNLWEPTWAIEGIATYNESKPELGQGRLRGPMYEAWLRIEHERGFKSLSEMNADGRALPTSKEYLYGAYFYDFLARKYGPDAIYKYIDNYSGNILPRVYSNPVAVTGKNMDELWREFIADLNAASQPTRSSAQGNAARGRRCHPARQLRDRLPRAGIRRRAGRGRRRPVAAETRTYRCAGTRYERWPT